MLEMIEILKVKREFLYLLLTLTQEKNVKVSRFPLIHLDETILAHTNLAEFRKFLQEPENEALLDRMVIIQVPYTLDYKEEARIYKKLTSSTQAFREVHLDPHALHVAAVFAVLSRLPGRRGARTPDTSRKCASTPARTSKACAQPRPTKIRAKNPEEGLAGVSPRFVINALSNAIIQSSAKSLTTHGRADRAQGRDRVRRAHRRQEEAQVDRLPGRGAQGLLQPLGEGRRAQGAVRLLRAGSAAAARQVSRRGRGDARQPHRCKDPITNEERKPDERFLRSVEEKIHISESGKQSFRQEVVRKAMGAYKRGEKFTLDSHAPLHDAVEQYLFEQRRDVLRLVSSTRAARTKRRGRRSRWSRSAWSTSTATTATARARR